MSFDVTNAADLLALKTEGNSYPAGSTTAEILTLINDPANNAGGETGVSKLTPENLLGALFDEAISSQDQFKLQLVFEASSSFTENISQYRSNIKALSVQVAAAIDLLVRPLSRAEVLFAGDDATGSKESVTISRTDWITARES